MRRMFRDTPDLTQGESDRVCIIIKGYLRLHRVENASDLPEEARVRLVDDIELFLKTGMIRRLGPRTWLGRVWDSIVSVISEGYIPSQNYDKENERRLRKDIAFYGQRTGQAMFRPRIPYRYRGQ